MSTILKDKIAKEIKERDLTPDSIFQVVKNSWNGIICYAKEGKSIIIYLVCALIEILMGIVYQINGLEWILIVCILGIILTVEIINTAIEAVCDAVTKEYNDFIRIAKDCGSASTFVMFIVAIILNIIIFLPKIVALF